MRKYLDIFIKEAEDHLATLQRGLLLLEKDPADCKLIIELLRSAHTIKGSARMMSFDDIAIIGHAMEDLLKDLEQGKRETTLECVQSLLAGVDAIEALVEALRSDSPAPVDAAEIASLVREVKKCDKAPSPQRPAAPPSGQEEEGHGAFSVRTSVETLDRLVNCIGEFIIENRRLEERLGRLRQIATRLEGSEAGELLREFCHDTEEDLLFRNFHTGELQHLAMKLRTLPFSDVVEQFQRMVRDLAVSQGKEVDLRVSGGAIEMDRVMLDYLKPSLLHMLRNAVDHGLESPEERLNRGKQRRGTVDLTLRHEGNGIRIEIRDDGYGLNAESIRQAAVRKRVVSAEEAARLSDEEAVYLIFRPGFSTRDTVTEISGRGIGLDVVRRNVELVQGNLILKTEPGEFTSITLHLPVTLSVIEALLVTCGPEFYAIPLTYVQETIRIRREAIQTTGGKDVVALRGATVPLVSLRTLLGADDDPRPFPQGGASAVILRYQDGLAACIVDDNLGTMEIVVKSLGSRFKKIGYVSGATVMGDGGAALILNVPDVFKRMDGTPTAEIFAAEENGERPAILVVDDSITTRTMERGILITHGYDVEVAVSGEDALEKVAQRQFDLIVADIEMPGINGFELTRQLRETPSYQDVPVIIVSSLSRDEDKRKALEAGAQRYIVKGSFDQGALLEAVESLLG